MVLLGGRKWLAPLVRQTRTVLDLYSFTGRLLGLPGLTTVGTPRPGPSDRNLGATRLLGLLTSTWRMLQLRLYLLSTTDVPILPGAGRSQSRTMLGCRGG